MANIFDEDVAAARELIDLYGIDCDWQKPAPLVEDEPGYPTVGDLPDPVRVKIAFFSPRDLGRGSEAFMALLVGTEVPTSGEIGLMAGGLSFSPDDSDSLIRDPEGAEEPLTITKIDRLAPNGLPILYYVSVAS